MEGTSVFFGIEQIVHTSCEASPRNYEVVTLAHFDSAAIIRRLSVVCIEAIDYCPNVCGGTSTQF